VLVGAAAVLAAALREQQRRGGRLRPGEEHRRPRRSGCWGYGERDCVRSCA
jgi:hypothetical protein